MIQDIVSSPAIYTNTASILKPDYFSEMYQPVVEFIHNYYIKYNAIPQIDQLNVEFDIDFEVTSKITRDRVDSTSDMVEKFCRESAVKLAINDSLQDIEDDNMSAVLERVTEATRVALRKDLGLNVYDAPEERLNALVETFRPIPTGIAGIDIPLDGGLVRKQFTLFSANSGGGKSLMLANIGRNIALQGYHVLYISLELVPEMVFLRLASIISGFDASKWRYNIHEIAKKITDEYYNISGGSYQLIRLPQHSTAADINSYLADYEMEYERVPDIICLDYLDLMDPMGGVKNYSIFDQDKRKSEEVVEIFHNYDAMGVSASQQNRDALRMANPDQGVIAGGISKVNTVDNYISLYMDKIMRMEGVMNASFLKTRSSKGVGHTSELAFNPNNLRISDPHGGGQTSVMPSKRKISFDPDLSEVEGLTGLDDTKKETDENLFTESLFDDTETTQELNSMLENNEVDEKSVDELMSVMSDITGNE